MVSNPYFKSVLWLVAFGGIGYGLMLLTSPSAEKIERIRASSGQTHLTADEQIKKAMFMKKLQEAASSNTSNHRQLPSASEKKDV